MLTSGRITVRVPVNAERLSRLLGTVYVFMIGRPSTCSLHPRTRFFLFFFNDTATTEIYTLSLHDALPIFSPSSPTGRATGSCGLSISTRAVSGHCYSRAARGCRLGLHGFRRLLLPPPDRRDRIDRKSTRLNSSHDQISYAVFCLKKKKVK